MMNPRVFINLIERLMPIQVHVTPQSQRLPRHSALVGAISIMIMNEKTTNIGKHMRRRKRLTLNPIVTWIDLTVLSLSNKCFSLRYICLFFSAFQTPFSLLKEYGD